jgi:hypothetical protein
MVSMISRGGDVSRKWCPCNVPPRRRPAVRVAGVPALSPPLPHTFLGDGSIKQQQTKEGFLNLGSSLFDGGLQAPSPTFLINQQTQGDNLD